MLIVYERLLLESFLLLTLKVRLVLQNAFGDEVSFGLRGGGKVCVALPWPNDCLVNGRTEGLTALAHGQARVYEW